MRELKMTVIGAGSTYTPEIIEGLIQRENSLKLKSLYLMDIAPEKLEVVGGLAKRMMEASGFTGEVVLTTDLDEALAGADYVFAQIRVGGMDARIRDEKIPLKYGLLGQETTGAGGFMNALRTVPVVLDFARRMEKLCPDAWLINFSNPAGIVAEAVLNHTNIKMLGLCNCPINMLTAVEKGIGTKDFEYEYLGLNHLSWITAVTRDGKNILADIDTGEGAKMKNIPDVKYDEDLLRAVGAIPSDYLSYFSLRDAQVKKCLEAEQTRGEVCVGLEESLLEKYKNPSLHEKPVELESRGGALYSTAAVSVVDAIENDKHEYHVVNVKNNGAIPFLEDNDVVEVKCMVTRQGITPVGVKTYSPYIQGLMSAVKQYEKLTVKAAMSGSRDDAVLALMVHPLIGDYDKAKAVLEDMIQANAEFLPQFVK